MGGSGCKPLLGEESQSQDMISLRKCIIMGAGCGGESGVNETAALLMSTAGFGSGGAAGPVRELGWGAEPQQRLCWRL